MKKVIVMLLLSVFVLDTYAAPVLQQDTTKNRKHKTVSMKKKGKWKNKRDTTRTDSLKPTM